jgi:serine/threonine-protein kinase
MADVYAADDLRANRTVAVKLLRRELAGDPDFVARFKREAEAAAALRHPHIVGAFDWGASEDSYYLAMEYVAGSTLKKLIYQHAPLREDEARRIAAEVADGLEFAHRHGIIHRDVKPQNVLIDAAGHARLADFGIARLLGRQHAQTTGFVLGTFQYFSPEQARGEPVDHRTDIYSLGVVLFELLTGRLPFEGETPMSVAIKQASSPPPSPRVYTPGVSDASVEIVRRALASDPVGRFQTAAEFRDALRQVGAFDRLPSLGDAPTRVVSIATSPARKPVAAPARRLPRYARWSAVAFVAMALALVAVVAAQSRNPAVTGGPDLMGAPSATEDAPAPTTAVATVVQAPTPTFEPPPTQAAPAHAAPALVAPPPPQAPPAQRPPAVNPAPPQRVAPPPARGSDDRREDERKQDDDRDDDRRDSNRGNPGRGRNRD